MKKTIAGFIAAIVCTALTAGSATAADYVITWKNQFAANAECTLETSVRSPAGTTPYPVTHTFAAVGYTRLVAVNSAGCTGILLSASCIYPDAKGNKHSNSFSNQNTFCGNHTATLNAATPGTITVTEPPPKQ